MKETHAKPRCRFVTASVSSSVLSNAVIAQSTSGQQFNQADLLGWIRLPDFTFSLPWQHPDHGHADPLCTPNGGPRFPPWKQEGGGTSAPQAASPPSSSPRNSLVTSSSSAHPPEEEGSLCVEVSGGLRRVYRPQVRWMGASGTVDGGVLRSLVTSCLGLVPPCFGDKRCHNLSNKLAHRPPQGFKMEEEKQIILVPTLIPTLVPRAPPMTGSRWRRRSRSHLSPHLSPGLRP